jgi:hypothetical protein
MSEESFKEFVLDQLSLLPELATASPRKSSKRSK